MKPFVDKDKGISLIKSWCVFSKKASFNALELNIGTHLALDVALNRFLSALLSTFLCTFLFTSMLDAMKNLWKTIV